jgi:hypothetical protein
MLRLENDYQKMKVHFDSRVEVERYHKMKHVSNHKHENVDEQKVLLDEKVILLIVLIMLLLPLLLVLLVM